MSTTLYWCSEIALRWIKIPAAPFIELWNISIRCAAVWTWTNLKGRSSRRELKIVLLQAVCLSIKYTLLTQDSEQGLLLKENQCYILVNVLHVYHRCMEITENLKHIQFLQGQRNSMAKHPAMVLSTLHVVVLCKTRRLGDDSSVPDKSMYLQWVLSLWEVRREQNSLLSFFLTDGKC